MKSGVDSRTVMSCILPSSFSGAKPSAYWWCSSLATRHRKVAHVPGSNNTSTNPPTDGYGVPFTYIENCWLDSPLLKAEIEKFVRVVTIMKDFNGMRIGQISLRPRQFHSADLAPNQEGMRLMGGELVQLHGSSKTGGTRR